MSSVEQMPPEEAWAVGPLESPKLGFPMPSEEFPVEEVLYLDFEEPGETNE